MKNIYLVRHGQSETNAGGAAKPNASIALTNTGHQQALEVADWLCQEIPTINMVHISCFLRTQQTAQPLLERLGMEANVIDGLQEFDHLSFNRIDGLNVHERLALADAYWQNFSPTQTDGADVESFAMFVARVQKVMDYFEQLPNGNHVVFTHGLWISMLIWLMLRQPVHDNQSMQKFRQFELSIRAKNCEVFLLNPNGQQSSIYKVRTCTKSHQATGIM